MAYIHYVYCPKCGHENVATDDITELLCDKCDAALLIPTETKGSATIQDYYNSPDSYLIVQPPRCPECDSIAFKYISKIIERDGKNTRQLIHVCKNCGTEW